MKNQIIGIIPARYKSYRFLGKLLHKIGSKTLLEHTFNNAKSCKSFDNIFIATEDESIKNEANKIHANCLMTKICPNGTHRIIQALRKNKILQASEIIVNIQGDYPTILPQTIEKTIDILKNDNDATCSTAATTIDYKHAKSKNAVKCIFNKNQDALYFSRSLIPYSKNPEKENYYYHIGIYAYKTKFLYELGNLSDTPLQLKEDLEQLKVLEHGYKIKVAIVNDMPYGVDVFEDIQKVERVLCR